MFNIEDFLSQDDLREMVLKAVEKEIQARVQSMVNKSITSLRNDGIQLQIQQQIRNRISKAVNEHDLHKAVRDIVEDLKPEEMFNQKLMECVAEAIVEKFGSYYC